MRCHDRRVRQTSAGRECAYGASGGVARPGPAEREGRLGRLDESGEGEALVDGGRSPSGRGSAPRRHAAVSRGRPETLSDGCTSTSTRWCSTRRRRCASRCPAAGIPAAIALRLGGRAWALVAPLSLLGTILRSAWYRTVRTCSPGSPCCSSRSGCALGLGWAIHGARPWLALLTVPLLVVRVRRARGCRRPRGAARARSCSRPRRRVGCWPAARRSSLLKAGVV